MSEYPLPDDRFSAETYITALENVIERYTALGDPVVYKDAALDGMAATTASSCLAFLKKLGLLETEKQGVYIPPDFIIHFVESGYDTSTQSALDVYSSLDENELYKEARFALGRGEYELNELAEQIADRKEIEEVDEVEKFLEILDMINLLRFDPDEVPEDNTELGHEQESQRTEENISAKSILDLDSVQIDYEELPRRANPEQLLDILKVLNQGGTWQNEGIADESGINGKYVSGNLKYGQLLGFIDRTEEGVILTDEGIELAFKDEFDEEAGKMFREQLATIPEYMAILQALADEGLSEADLIENEDVLRILKRDFGLRTESSDKLKRAISVLFKTLDVAGYGELKEASGSYPTRFRFGEDRNLADILSSLVEMDHIELKVEETEAELDDVVEEAGTSEEESASDSIQEGTTSAMDVEKEHASSSGKLDRTSTGIVELNIQVDIEKMDSAELEAKLKLIKEYLL